MSTALVPLEIYSDPICPWCFIGKTRLDRALEAAPDHPFDVIWKPFQLNPDMPPEGMDRREYLETKFGGRKAAVDTYMQIAAEAERTGLDIPFEKIARTPNTLDAHRLIHWARLEGKQNAVVNQLFRRFFMEGQDISDHAVLTATAQSAGMDAELVARLLASDADVAEVRGEDAQAREMGIRGVPCFIIGRRYVLNGAQPVDLWTKVIGEIVENLKADQA